MTKENIVISIIIPVYNGEKYLEQCLDSCLTQTYSNIEIILLDDESKDASREICKKYQELDSRIKYIEKENGGVSQTRNMGIELSRGDFLIFLDNDDFLENNACEILLEEYKRWGADVVCCCSYWDYKDRTIIEGGESNESWVAISDLKDKEHIIKKILGIKDDNEIYLPGAGVPFGKMFKTSLIRQQAIRYPVGVQPGEDNLFNCRCYFYGKKVSYLDRPLFHYRIRGDSEFHNGKNKYASMLRFYEEFSSADECNYSAFLSERDLQGFYIKGLLNCLANIWDYCRQYDKKLKTELKNLKETNFYQIHLKSLNIKQIPSTLFTKIKIALLKYKMYNILVVFLYLSKIKNNKNNNELHSEYEKF